MKKMNLLMILLLLSLTACGDKETQTKTAELETELVSEIAVAETNTAEIKTKENKEFTEGAINTSPYDNMSLNEKNEALVVSSSNGELEAVKGLIASGALVNFKDKFETTPLMAASYSASYNTEDKYLEIVKYLISKGADVNVTTITYNYIDTALTMSIHHGGKSPEVVKFLIDSGADTSAVFKNMYDYSGNTAWGEAIEYGSIEIIKYLVAKGVDTKNTTIFDWARVGWLEKVQECVENGADITAINDLGFTVLMTASMTGNLEIVKYLIENGADINATDQKGKTAFSYVFTNLVLTVEDEGLEGLEGLEYQEIIKYLIEKGSNIDITIYNKPILIYASRYGHLEIVKLLVANGADINATDQEGKTALTMAKEAGHTEVVAYLETLK